MSKPSHCFPLEVRYYETDAQGVVHHANYLRYFELARVEMLKAYGHHYAELEQRGIILVVHSVSCRYHRPARFGDTLRIEVDVDRATPARIDHQYRVLREDALLADGKSTIACVDAEGNVKRMPEFLRGNPEKGAAQP